MMNNEEKTKHIDAFKYQCETNEENGVITIPKFLCDHIIEILDDTNARPHGKLREEVLSMICKVNDYYGYTDSMHMFKVLFDQKYHGWVKKEGDPE